MIRVVQLSTTESVGGAALAAHRLHDALNAHAGDVRSTLFVGMAQAGGPGVREFNPAAPAPRGVGRWLFRAGRRLQRRVRTVDGPLFSQDWTVFGRRPLRQIPPADVHHLHWTADLVDFRMLAPLARRGPLVWTLHDMNPFTGGCHYDAGCDRFTTRCGECPILVAPAGDDASSQTLRRKHRALAALPDNALTVVCPSAWLAGESRRSALFKRFDARVIPNGIDLKMFRPVEDRAAVRDRLGLKPSDRAVLFVAEIIDDIRKGRRELERVLAETARRLPNLRVLTLGQGDTTGMTGLAFRHLGKLSDPEAIRDAYAAADLFVIPSLQDNFPNTVIEAMACGTPVAGFATGGVGDAVEEGVSGTLAPTGDTARLTDEITHLLNDDPLRAVMGQAARTRAETHYGLPTQAAAYRALYDELLQNRTAIDSESTMKAAAVRTGEAALR